MPSSPLPLRRRIIAIALAVSGATFIGALPAAADAAPAATPQTAITADSVPSDGILSAAIDRLRAEASDPASLQAALAILQSLGQRSQVSTPVASPAAASPADFATMLAAANALLNKLGVQTFINPSVAFNCVDPTADNPFGLAPAVSGAVAGPWAAPGISLPTIPLVNIDPNVVKSGQVLYGFVPGGLGADTNPKGMQVAWFNVNTFKGGFVDMGPSGQTLLDTWLANIPAQFQGIARNALQPIANTLTVNGSRLAPVDTDHGTVLSAVFGNVQNGNRSCFFFPMVGIVQA
ncbi:hypothetical protein [Jongsikchunia kroppenstedtii]|uniref:hypothetical protein n=1 Tax=Jongsikchunia kroppenstedtii TaxID=1121721 RepID=UPI0003A456F5|nr:hypothetical protein [Jongsikchunia kroppenstedtii]